MSRLDGLFESPCAKQGEAWQYCSGRVDVTLGNRGQAIKFERDGTDYVFTSVVLGRAAVTKDVQRWRRLAMLAWQRNAEHQLVTFAFDQRDRLVGQIRHLAEHLDSEELELYVATLARECDRLEYLLTGRDDF